jgi:hypothetical protein
MRSSSRSPFTVSSSLELELWSAARASSGSSFMASAGPSSSRNRLELIGRQKRAALLRSERSNVVRSVELVVRPWAWMGSAGELLPSVASVLADQWRNPTKLLPWFGQHSRIR